MGKLKKDQKTFGKMAILALNSQNFEKVYEIKIKIWTIVHTISKAHTHWLSDGGAILLLKKCSDIKLSPGNKKMHPRYLMAPRAEHY